MDLIQKFDSKESKINEVVRKITFAVKIAA